MSQVTSAQPPGTGGGLQIGHVASDSIGNAHVRKPQRNPRTLWLGAGPRVPDASWAGAARLDPPKGGPGALRSGPRRPPPRCLCTRPSPSCILTIKL